MCRHKQIVRKVKELVGQNPAECIILQGYSQGASATCDALPELTGPAFDAVKGVVLLGNPEHRPDLTCNVDLYGGKSTRKAVGFFGTKGGIPSEWASKSLDVCNFVSLRPRRARLIYIAFKFSVLKSWDLHGLYIGRWRMRLCARYRHHFAAFRVYFQSTNPKHGCQIYAQEACSWRLRSR